jgi:adenosylhomocysteinase
MKSKTEDLLVSGSKRFPSRRKRLPSSLVSNIERGTDFVEKSVDITGQLKVLRELVSETTNADQTHSVILQHILPTTVEFIDQVNTVYPVDLVIAIVYSADAKTVEPLEIQGI